MIYKELEKFRSIRYVDKNHTYQYTLKSGSTISLTSVTTKINQYKGDFDTAYWTVFEALKRSGYDPRKEENGAIWLNSEGESIMYNAIPDDIELYAKPEEIAKEWKHTARVGTTRGSLFHAYMEQKIYNREFPMMCDTSFLNGETKAFNSSLDKLKKMGDKFFEENRHLIPIRSELTVGDPNLMLAGTIDQLFWNTKDEEYQLWDWKTDKKFRRNNRWQTLLNGLEHLDECEFNKYGLQVGLYKYIIERNVDIKLGTSHVVWFNHSAEDYEIVKLDEFEKEVKYIAHGKSRLG